jgi:hypothetical protein
MRKIVKLAIQTENARLVKEALSYTTECALRNALRVTELIESLGLAWNLLFSLGTGFTLPEALAKIIVELSFRNSTALVLPIASFTEIAVKILSTVVLLFSSGEKRLLMIR